MAGMRFPARYNDGATARTYAVEASVEAQGLRLEGEGVSVQFAYSQLKLIAAGADLRLGVRGAPDARIVLPGEARAAFAAAAPGTLESQSDFRGYLRLTLGLVLVAALVVGATFFGVPMAAGPLARATPPAVERQLGANLATQVHALFDRCEGPEAEAAARAAGPLLARLEAASTPGFPIVLTFLNEEAPNALALPGGQVMVTRGLLNLLETPEELAAVLAHELAHVEHRDGMMALYRHAGLGILLDIITGGSGLGQQLVLISGQLTELSFTRRQEDAADARALAALAAAGLDPADLGRALERLSAWSEDESKSEKRRLDLPEWLASHPDTGARIAKAKAAGKPVTRGAMSADAWATVRAACTSAER